ncbi:MAG: amidohydrolase [Kiritimatiellae bacterium]|nr:amidohydrolase [Kiritimatiellia bacterium]
MIIDTHVHLGYDNVFDYELTEDDLVSSCRAYGITGSIVQPFIPRPYIADTAQIHDRIHAFCRAHPGAFWGMASIHPHFRPEEYEKEATRCVKELGFVGIKLTPIGHATHPSSQDGLFVFEVAQRLGVPVMIHTGDGGSFADPVAVIPAVKRFPAVKTILAHAGTDLWVRQAMYLAETFDNVYLEPSWVNVLSVREMVRTLGPHRIMFSSDDPLNIPVELAKYRAAITDAGQLEQALAGTAVEVFGLKGLLRNRRVSGEGG